VGGADVAHDPAVAAVKGHPTQRAGGVQPVHHRAPQARSAAFKIKDQVIRIGRQRRDHCGLDLGHGLDAHLQFVERALDHLDAEVHRTVVGGVKRRGRRVLPRREGGPV